MRSGRGSVDTGGALSENCAAGSVAKAAPELIEHGCLKNVSNTPLELRRSHSLSAQT